MQHGAMNAGFLQAVFTMQFPVFVRKPARYQIRLEKPALLDLTSHKQDVVQIAIEPENSPVEIFPNTENSPMYFDNSHTIEIETKGLLIVRRHTVVGANRILFFRESPARSCRAGNCRTFFPAWRYIVVALFEEQRCCF